MCVSQTDKIDTTVTRVWCDNCNCSHVQHPRAPWISCPESPDCEF